MKIVRVLLACLKAEAYPHAGEALCRGSLRLPSGEPYELCALVVVSAQTEWRTSAR